MRDPEDAGERRFVPTPESEMDDDRRLRVLLDRLIEEKFYVGPDGYYCWDALVYKEEEGPETAKVVVTKTKWRAVSVTTAGLSGLAKGDIWGISDFFSELFDDYRAASEPNNDLRRMIMNNVEMFEVFLRVGITPLWFVGRDDSFTVYGERYVVLGVQGEGALFIENAKGGRKTITGMLIHDDGSFRRCDKRNKT